MIRRFLFACAAAAVAFSASATVRTWKPTGGGNFYTSANWDPSGRLQNNDELVFNNVEGVLNNNLPTIRTFKKITITGSKSFTIVGNAFKLGAGGILCQTSANTVKVTISNNVELLNANTPFAFTNADHKCGSVAFCGVISGAGGIWKTGSGAIHLHANNTFAGSFIATGDGYTDAGQIIKSPYDRSSSGGPGKIESGATTPSGIVHAYADSALGLKEARIGWNLNNAQTWDNTALYVHGPVCITTPYIYTPTDRDNSCAKLYLCDGDVKIMSDIVWPAQSRIGTDIDKDGGWRDHWLCGNTEASATGYYIISVGERTRLHYMNTVCQRSGGRLYPCNNGEIWFHGQNNYFPIYQLNDTRQRIFCATNNALPTTTGARICWHNPDKKISPFNGVVNIGGFDQTLRQAPEEVAETLKKNVTDYGYASDAPAVVWFQKQLNDKQNFGFHGMFHGAAGLGWDATAKRATFVYSNSVCETTGRLVVSNGLGFVYGGKTDLGEYSAIRLANGASFTSLSKIELHPDRLLVVDDDAGGGLYCDEFWSDFGGVVLDGPQQLTCRKATIRDRTTGGSFTNLPAGVYYYADMPDTVAAEGTGGSLRVLPFGSDERFEWTGLGADDYLTTPANWKGGVAPDFALGNVKLVFNGGKGKAVVKGRLNVVGIEFATNANFTVSGVIDEATGESPALVFALGGIVATNVGEKAITYKIEPSVSLEFTSPAAGKWPISKNCTLDLACPMSGEQTASTIDFCGQGTAILRGDNRSMRTAFRFSCGVAQSWHPWALGASTRETIIDTDNFTFKDAGLTNNTPVSYLQSSDRGSKYPLSGSWTTPLVMRGAVTMRSSGNTGYNFGNWTFAGGFTRTLDNFWPSVVANCKWRFDGPCLWGTSKEGCSYVPTTINSGAEIIFGHTNNTWQCFIPTGPGWVRCAATNCLYRGCAFGLGRGQSKSGNLNLDGFDQEVLNLRHTPYSPNTEWDWKPTQGETSYCVVSSAPPAVVTIFTTNEYDVSDAKSPATVSSNLKYRGQVGLHYRGIGEYWLCNQYSDTTGPLTVSGGKVGFKWGAGWGGDVSVVGTGALVIDSTSAGKAFGKTCNLKIAESGKVTFGGGDECLRSLVINGVAVEPGRYAVASLDSTYVGGSGYVTVSEKAKPRAFVFIFQ